MLQIIINIFIMFILTIALMRIMGKSSIVQLTPYDLVAIFIIATIVTEPLITAEFIPAIIRVLIVVGFYLIFARLTLNQTLNKFLLGEPSILIKHGKIIEDTLEKEHISLIQLLSILRNAGYSKLTEIDFAILEPTGSISVIPIASSRPATLSDLNIDGKYEGLPLALIIDGKIQKNNLKLIEKNEVWVKEKVKAKGINNLKNIIYAFVNDQSNELYISLRENTETDSYDKNPKYPPTNNLSEDSNKEQYKINQEYILLDNSILKLKEITKAGISESKLKEQIKINDFKHIKTITLRQSFIIEKKKGNN